MKMVGFENVLKVPLSSRTNGSNKLQIQRMSVNAQHVTAVICSSKHSRNKYNIGMRCNAVSPRLTYDLQT